MARTSCNLRPVPERETLFYTARATIAFRQSDAVVMDNGNNAHRASGASEHQAGTIADFELIRSLRQVCVLRWASRDLVLLRQMRRNSQLGTRFEYRLYGMKLKAGLQNSDTSFLACLHNLPQSSFINGL
jgi:hypothetical protein